MRCEIEGQPLGTENGENVALSKRRFNAREKSSAEIINRDGDKGSPCRSPLEELKKPFDFSFINKEK